MSRATAEGVLEVDDRFLGLAEEEVQAAEVVNQPADVEPVRELLILGLRALGVRTGEHPVALALGDERGIEVDAGDRARVIDSLGELERTARPGAGRWGAPPRRRRGRSPRGVRGPPWHRPSS